MAQALNSGVAAFAPRARLLKLIGSELISDDVVAVLELVKNAYDADASTVRVEFQNVTDPANARIVIEDDGCGMSLDALLGHWMSPAGTSKGRTGLKVTTSGRRMLGEKGVGRFATDKLGRQLELVSRVAGADTEVRAFFDWDEFDCDTALLSEIASHWEVRPASPERGPGTTLQISGLRGAWTERMFKRLSTKLARLTSPFSEVEGFRINIESDEFPRYSGDVQAPFLDRAPYRLEATFDGNSSIAIHVDGHPPRLVEWNETFDLGCGPVTIRLFAFDLEGDALARLGPRMEARAWLKDWCGISVFRDGFRVWPYGEPHDDWLRLDQRRVNNPVLRLSNNQVVGFVEISSDRNPALRDQTNREGLIHNDAFKHFKDLMIFVIEHLELHRQGQRHPVERRIGTQVDRQPEFAGMDDSFERLAAKLAPENARELRRLGKVAKTAIESEATRFRKVEEAYAELAALGQATETCARDLRVTMAAVQAETAAVRERIDAARDEVLGASIANLSDAVDALVSTASVLSPEEAGGARRRTIDVAAELDVCKVILRPVLDAAGVRRLEVKVSGSGILRVEMRPANLHRLIQILVRNAGDWLGNIEGPRIWIKVHGKEDTCQIVVSDNGPGIPEEIIDRVFDPFFSWKENGRGLGLTLARSIVQNHGGSIQVGSHRRETGADIIVALPRRRPRATVQ